MQAFLPVKKISSSIAALMRNFPWPVRHKHSEFPPLPDPTSNAATRLVVLGVPDRALESIWSAYTFCFWHGCPKEIEFAFDGDISDLDCEKIESKFPHAIISNACKYQFDGNKFPTLASFTSDFKFGRKLSLLINSTLNINTIYIDNDILFFKEDELLSKIVRDGSVDPWFVVSPDSTWITAGPLQEIAMTEGSPIVPGFNSGMMILPQGFLRIEEVEDLLSSCRLFEKNGQPFNGTQGSLSYSYGFEYFTEQSLFGLLIARSKSKQLSVSKYIHSNSGMNPLEIDKTEYSSIVMRHFFGTVRHRMYVDGMPAARRNILQCI